MTQHQTAHESGAVTIYCSHCGQPMRVAIQHMHGSVACPHCSMGNDPRRVQTSSHEAVTMPYPAAPRQIAYGPPRNEYGEEVSWRNRWIAGALAILIGVFGVHRFYLGYKGWGLIQVLMTVTLVLSPVVAVWTFVEGILCFVGAMRDVEGRPLSG